MSHLERSMVGGLFHPQGWRKNPLEMAGTLTGRKTLSWEVDKVALAVVSKNILFLTLELGEMLPRFDLHMFFFQMVFFPTQGL